MPTTRLLYGSILENRAIMNIKEVVLFQMLFKVLLILVCMAIHELAFQSYILTRTISFLCKTCLKAGKLDLDSCFLEYELRSYLP